MGVARALSTALVAAVVAAGGAPSAPAAGLAETAVTIDGGQGGRTFDGVGAISGGGGNSRLLIDYPEPQRGQLLDYLFRPGYGAAVQLLKVEVGGDMNSTDGAEASHQHTRGVVNCSAGYEFWLMEQAKARNPGIKLLGLSWGAPGWIGGGDFWSRDMINYLLSWLDCARTHNLTIDYLGGWNERGYDRDWYVDLKAALTAGGYPTKVVGSDNGWEIAGQMRTDPALNNAVDVVGAHYPCGYLSDSTECDSSADARATGKPLWASENGSLDMNGGSAALIRSITRGYLDARMTAYLNWPLIAALYPNLPFDTVGLANAPEPWSGAYRVGRSTWATAHVTQFAQPGWQFVDSASGYLEGDRRNGSYVTLKAANRSAYSVIVETTTAGAAQDLSVRVTGGLPTGTVRVWATDLRSSDTGRHFVRQADITPQAGRYSLTLQPGHVYSLTTTSGQGKGAATGPAPGRLALPYSDDFDGYAVGTQARLLADMQGAYEVQPCAGGRSGRCVQQMAAQEPINWQGGSDSYTLAGDVGWRDYTVSVDVLHRQAGTVKLLGRANQQSRPQNTQAAYELRVRDTGAWAIAKNDTDAHLTTLTSGTVPPLGLNRWHTLSLTMRGSAITARIDGVQVGSVTDGSYPAGQIGLGVVGYQTDQFDNLTVAPAGGGGGGGSGPIVSGLPGKCLDTDGTRAQLWDCTGGPSQIWTVGADGTVRHDGRCLDVTGAGTANGTAVILWDCHGGANQSWRVGAGESLVSVHSGRCLDDPGARNDNGTPLIIWDCNGGANQRWRLP
jgi:hypothetical protein